MTIAVYCVFQLPYSVCDGSDVWLVHGVVFGVKFLVVDLVS